MQFCVIKYRAKCVPNLLKVEQKSLVLQCNNLGPTDHAKPGFLRILGAFEMKMPLKGSRFQSRDEMRQNATAKLNTIPKKLYRKRFSQWKEYWTKCMKAQVTYFEYD
ncbi:hypothetical protein TNCV_4368331 [Trichonephila clavipes]|nr:hypothetical protein TNCV_4368331 [Trichonephila clavipes]